MAEIKVQKKRLPKWPWLAGAVVLGLLILGITKLVNSRAIAQISADSAAVIAGGIATTGTPDETAPPPLPSSSLEALLPLGTEDVGQRVAVNGEVVGTPSPDGYWVLSDVDVVIFVKGAAPA